MIGSQPASPRNAFATGWPEAPIVVVEDPFDIRLERLREEYFDHMWADFLPPTEKRQAGRSIASICTTACSPFAAVWSLQR